MYNKMYDFLYGAIISTIKAYKCKNTDGLIQGLLKIFAFLAVIALIIGILCVIGINLYWFYLQQLAAVRWMINLAIVFFIIPLTVVLLRKKG